MKGSNKNINQISSIWYTGRKNPRRTCVSGTTQEGGGEAGPSSQLEKIDMRYSTKCGGMHRQLGAAAAA